MKAKQRSRLSNIKCADTNSKLFYLRANCRKQKKHIRILRTPQGLAVSHEDKEAKIARHFNGLLGSKLSRSLSLNWSELDYPHFDLADLESDISIDEIKRPSLKCQKRTRPVQMALLEPSNPLVGT
jgi:hypothetical protein